MLQNCIVTLQTSVKWQNNMLLTLHTLPGSRTVHESVYLCSQIKLIWPRILQRFAEVWTLILFCWNWLTLLECKGKMKLMVENRTSDPLDPSPDCDCHVSKSHNIDLQSVTHQEAFESTQVSLSYDKYCEWYLTTIRAQYWYGYEGLRFIPYMYLFGTGTGEPA